jgi:hypothetical protein
MAWDETIHHQLPIDIMMSALSQTHTIEWVLLDGKISSARRASCRKVQEKPLDQ